jgi:ABC-type oligopeptide transport system ATPase subunit
MSAFLKLENLSVWFHPRKRLFGPPGEPLRAVDGVSLEVPRGQILGLVGESGCGKTTLTRAIMQLQPVTSGAIYLDGKDLSHVKRQEMRFARLDFQMVFQDPYASLNPRLTIFSALAEAIQARRGRMPGDELKQAVAGLMQRVGLSPAYALKYPHEFSGGQRQRIAIARALGPQPKLLLADEPVSALDVSIQSQILNLLLTLSRDLGLTMLFISHDLGVVRYVADRVAVMQAGKIVEQGDTESVMANPQHEYTRTLLASAPGLRRMA